MVDGIDICIDSTTIKVGGLITSLICDIKERDSLLYMNSGYYRCPYCYCTGKTYPPDKVVRFPYVNETISLRTKRSFHLDATFGMF